MQTYSEREISIAYDQDDMDQGLWETRGIGLIFILFGLFAATSPIFLFWYLGGMNIPFWFRASLSILLAWIVYSQIFRKGKSHHFVQHLMRDKPIKISVKEEGIFYFFKNSEKIIPWEQVKDIERLFWVDEKDPDSQMELVLKFSGDDFLVLSDVENWKIYEMIVRWTNTNLGQKIVETKKEEIYD